MIKGGDIITYLFATLMIGVVLLEVPTLLRARDYRELLVFSCFLLLGFYMGMVQLFNWPFYNLLGELALYMEAN